MPDLLASAATWLNDQLQCHAATGVTYRRGASSVALRATLGRTVFRHTDAYGTVIHSVSRDFILAPASLVLNGTTTLPEPGDLILEAVAGQTHAHEVMALTPDDPCWRYDDPNHASIRVHTKRVGSLDGGTSGGASGGGS